MTAAADLDPRTRALLEAAILAPSSHNTQPWVFRVDGDEIALYADRTRALPVNDTEDRELTISCGCALFNLRVAAAAAGLRADVRLQADRDDPDLLARVRLVPGTADAHLASLQPFLATRRTCRQRFDPRPVPANVLDHAATACAQEGATLRPLTVEGQRQQLALLVAEGDRAQWGDPRWRRELAAWLHPRRRGDGLAVPALAARVAQFVVRSFDMGDGIAAKDRQLADGSPLLAVLTTPGDNVASWIAAGQALQHMLLQACASGVQASFLNQPAQVAAVRTRLRELVGGVPQLVVRLGYAPAPAPPTARRPLDEVLA
ncbi:MAG TPA: nitroreductase family protein [Ramlibacter sp.]